VPQKTRRRSRLTTRRWPRWSTPTAWDARSTVHGDTASASAGCCSGYPLDEYDELLLLLDRLANRRWAEQIAHKRLAEQLVIAPSETVVDHRPGRETRAGRRAAGRVAYTP